MKNANNEMSVVGQKKSTPLCITVRHVRIGDRPKGQRVIFRFRPLKNRVICKTQGKPSIFVMPEGRRYLAVTSKGGVEASSAAKAFAKAAETFWA